MVCIPMQYGFIIRSFLQKTVFVLFAVFFFTNVFGQEAVSDYQVKPLYVFGEKGNQTGQFINPQGISIDPEGNIYIADTGNNRIQKFTPNGKFIQSVGGFGWESEQFNRPVDICAINGLDVFVADYENLRIERYDRDLNRISSFYSQEIWDEKFQFGFPMSVTISKHGELFIIDKENLRILKIDSFGEPAESFGDFDSGSGRLESPYQLAINGKDILAVSDNASNRIVFFDYFGNYLLESGDNKLNAPKGLGWFNDQALLVADSQNHRIVALNDTGRILFKFGSVGNKIGAFRNPTDVACFNRLVYVLDGGNGRVEVFMVSKQ